jgi:hypothetical protein
MYSSEWIAAGEWIVTGVASPEWIVARVDPCRSGSSLEWILAGD